MDSVIEINRKKNFCLEEVRSLLPVFYYVTSEPSRQVKVLSNRVQAFSDKGHPAVGEIEAEISTIVDGWQTKIAKLGGKPKGLWLVDFDNGDGYFCWKYPETEIKYWHGYQDGFSGRIMIE